MTEPTLPGMPDTESPAARKPNSDRAVRIHTTGLCEQCCQDIHRYGVAGAPYPRVARWRVVQGETARRLCEGHKEERLP